MKYLLAASIPLVVLASAAQATYLSDNFDHQDVLGNGWDNITSWDTTPSHMQYPQNQDPLAGPDNVGCVVPWQDNWRLGKALDLSNPLDDQVVIQWDAWQHAGTRRHHIIYLVDGTGAGVGFKFRMELRDTVPEAERCVRGGVGTTADNGATYSELQDFQTLTGTTYGWDDMFANRYVWTRSTGDVSYYRDGSLIGSVNVGVQPDPTYLVIYGNNGWDENQGIDDLVVIPEPVTLGLFGLGSLGLLLRRRRA